MILSLGVLQESGNFSELAERLHNSIIVCLKGFLHPLESTQRDCPEQLLLKLDLLLK